MLTGAKEPGDRDSFRTTSINCCEPPIGGNTSREHCVQRALCWEPVSKRLSKRQLVAQRHMKEKAETEDRTRLGQQSKNVILGSIEVVREKTWLLLHERAPDSFRGRRDRQSSCVRKNRSSCRRAYVTTSKKCGYCQRLLANVA